MPKSDNTLAKVIHNGVFRLVYNSTPSNLQENESLRRYTGCNQDTSNMAAVTDVNRMT